MGLDMYLVKQTYIWIDDRAGLHISGKGTEHIKPERVKRIEEEVGYWRKANAIHRWFVTNVQECEDNCATYHVSTEHLETLLGLVNAVLADHSKAPELLPTQSGFSFGDTDYDEWYFKDLEHTKAILEEALAEDNGVSDYSYYSSW